MYIHTTYEYTMHEHTMYEHTMINILYMFIHRMNSMNFYERAMHVVVKI